MAVRPLLTVFALLCVTSPAAAKWNYYRSPNFELYADGSPGKAKDILNHFEQLHDLLSRIIGPDFEADRPVRLIAFNSEVGFKRVYKGGESTYAFYTRSRDRNYIVFQELNSEMMYEVGVHEYIHLRTSQMGLPAWLSEGMSELYSTTYAPDAGVRIGRSPRNVKAAGVGSALSMEELLGASRADQKLWSNRNKVFSLYTKGWALTSMLTMHEAYRDRFSEFLFAVIGGEKSEDAIQGVYGKTAKELEQDLSRFLTGFTVPIMTYDTKWGKEKRNFEPRPVEDAEEGLLLADLLAVLGRGDEARKSFQAVVEIDDQNAEAHAGLGRAAPDDAAALKALARAVELGSPNAYVYLDYIRTLLRQGRGADEAVQQALAKAVELRPDLAEPHLLLAAFAHQAGDHARELLELRRAKDMDPAGAYARALWMAQAALENGSSAQSVAAAGEGARYVHSERQLENVQRLMQPANSPAAVSLAQVDAWVLAGDLEPAAAGLAALQRRYPDARPIYERFAEVQRRRGDAEGALATEAAARRLGYAAVFDLKRFMEAANRRISLLDAGGFYDRSQVFFDAVLELDPDNSGLLNNRAYTLADNDVLLDRAVEMAERAMQLLDKEPSAAVRDTLGWVYAKVQRGDEALEIFEQLVKEDRKSPVFHYHYGVVLGQLDRKEDAARAFDVALESKTITEAFRKKIQDARDELTKTPGN